jgi:hypothetical protein
MSSAERLERWQGLLARHRPGGERTRCRNCIYWEVADVDALIDLIEEGDSIFSYVMGECRRHASRPMQSIVRRDYFEYLTEGVDEYDVHNWPQTDANEWCGEFRDGRTYPDLETCKQYQEERRKEQEENDRAE